MSVRDNNLYALNPTDGSLKWKYATGNVSILPGYWRGWHDLCRVNG